MLYSPEMKWPIWKQTFLPTKAILHANEAMFSDNANELDRAYDNLQQMGTPEDAWDAVAPNVEFQNAQQEDEGSLQERELPQEDHKKKKLT